MVIKDKRIKDGVAKFTKYAQIIKDAPIIICIFFDISDSYNRDKDIMAIGGCIQSMLLCAHSIGLGTCWLGEILNKKEEVERFLKTDSDYELIAVITVGFSDEQITKGCRKPLRELMIK